MSYKLGDLTLPEPKSIQREVLENSQENITLTGKTTKRTLNRKQRYILSFQYLTQQQVNQLFSEVNLEVTRTFTVDEDNLTIGPVDVFIDLDSRGYEKTAEQFRENIDIILTEVR